MPNIFVSYRRDDSGAIAGWIHEKLSNRYGTSVFRDIDNIGVSENFRSAIGRALRHCDIVVAIIGPRWLGPKDDGKRRIDDERDWIRVEIEMALQLGIHVIPVLVERAQMPRSQEVPEGMREVTERQALVIDSGSDFHNHINRLTETIDRLPIDARVPPAPPVPLVSPVPAPSRGIIARILKPFPSAPGDSAGARLIKLFGNLFLYSLYLTLMAAFIGMLTQK
jgi:hypothetical protein